MHALVTGNLALRFLLEVAALALVAWWGWRAGDGVSAWALALAAPLALAAVWGLFVSPKARIRLPRVGRLAVELAVWCAGGAALWALGRPWLGLAFLVVAVASGVVNDVWREREGGYTGTAPPT